MTPPLAAVEARRNLLTAITAVAISTNLVVVPADFTTWTTALRITEYKAWRHKGGDITVQAVGWHQDRVIRVTAVFTTVPPFMTPDQANALPAFDGPLPAAVIPFPEAA